MSAPELTIALGRYDRHVPFFMGMVDVPDGAAGIKPLNVGMTTPASDGMNRHGRMLHDREFDIAEVSLASYIVAKARGKADGLTGSPVFPRRLFSQNQIFVNVDSGIQTPADLEGKRVGVNSFQTTLSVLAKGDLKLEYGVDWETIRWVQVTPDEIETEMRPGVSVELAGRTQAMGDMLVHGEIDALFMPNPPVAALARPDRVRRLFPDPRAECLRYFKKYGTYPIMHLMAIKTETLDAVPDLPAATIAMWEQAKSLAIAANHDPSYSHVLFAHQELEAQDRLFGADAWPSGLAANRDDLARFITYLVDQGMIDAGIQPEDLFHESVLNT